MIYVTDKRVAVAYIVGMEDMMRKSTSEAAIEQSIRQDEIVTVDGDAEVHASLFRACADSVRTTYDRGPDTQPGRLTEYWGADADGDEWRVHVRD